MQALTSAKQTSHTHPVDIGRGIMVPGYIWAALSEIKVGTRRLKHQEKLMVCRARLFENFILTRRLNEEIKAHPAAKKDIDDLFTPLREALRQAKDVKIHSVALVGR